MTQTPTVLEKITVRDLSGYTFSIIGYGSDWHDSALEYAQILGMSFEDADMQFLDYNNSHNVVVDLFDNLLEGSNKLIVDTIKRYANFDYIVEDKDIVLLQFAQYKGNIDRHYNPQDYSLSGGVTSPVAVLAHFMFGDGHNLNVDLDQIGIQMTTNEAPELQKLIDNKSFTGDRSVNTKFAYSMYNDDLVSAAYLGNITLRLTGNFHRTSKDKWSFDGTLKGFNDLYDANASNHRGAIAELSTAILDKLGSVSRDRTFSIEFNGDIKVHFDQNDKELNIADYLYPEIQQNQLRAEGWDFA